MAEEAQTKRYLIGYALEPKKISSFLKPSLINLSKQRGIDLIPIEPTKPLTHQNPSFHCIIHKISDPNFTQNLQIYKTHNPNVIIIDAPEAISRLHSRLTMLEAVQALEIPSLSFPHQVFVKSPDSDFFDLSNFPLIAKPVVADGTDGSHQMYLVLNKKGLEELKLEMKVPFVLQEFVNHGGVVFKVYVAGEHVQCVKRKSLPDVKEGGVENLVPFSRISNVDSVEYGNGGESVEKLIEAAELPGESFVVEVAMGLRRGLGLNLFNFDMIRVRGDGGDRYLVIDINYFPGYAKMPGYETMLTDFFLDVVQKE